MLWKFSFASGSTLDTLLSRETPPSIEELLDEQDILAECKAQNAKLITYLSREDSVNSLLHWVTSGLDDLDKQATRAEDKAYKDAIASKDIFPEFAVAGDAAEAKGKAEGGQDSDQDDSGPLAPGMDIGLGEGLGPVEETNEDNSRANYPRVAAEILTSELWTIPETIMAHKETLLKSFWDAVIPPIESKDPDLALEREKARAHTAFWTDEDEERERKREVIRGLWMRVNASLLQKRTTEMVRFIQTLPDIIERMIARIESPAIQDMLARIIQTEEAGVSDVMSWLRDQRLVPRLLELLSPKYPPSTHQIVADLLKGIISVSAPNSSFNPQGGNAMAQEGGSSTARDNRLVRELTSGQSIETLVGYIVDPVTVTDADWDGIDGGGVGQHRSDPFVIHPLPSIPSVTSSLCYVCNVIVEIIRRNNSDLAEPYLFNMLRNLLMGIQSEQMAHQQEIAPDEASPETDDESEDATRQKMEGALPELADKLAIVHLGNLVTALTDRFPQLHQLLLEPRSSDRVKSAQNGKPLTMERFRIIELYAELLHSSNMSTLNRVPGNGPEYSADGALLGGLDGLDRLGHALQANEAGDETQEEEVQLTQARELPISSSSTDYSLTESDDVALSDGEETPSTQTTPVATTAPTLEITVPPPPSPADAERLRTVMGIEPDTVSPSDADSHAAVAATTVAPSVASDAIAEPNTQLPSPVEELSAGERLKQQFINYQVLPTLMDLFFEHANNNFLHHLVYDILQQILNGQLDRGFNRELVVDLFQRAKLVDRVLVAQRMNDELVASIPPKPRLSYMGHITLIAEELVKFFVRCPPDLFEIIKPSFNVEAWEAFVTGSLRETRARDTQPLAGGKPATGLGSGLSTNSERSDSESDDDDDQHAGLGEPLSRTSAKQPGDSFHDASADDDDDGELGTYWRPSNSRSAAMDSSDDDDDADWLRPSGSRRGDDDDEFGAFHSTSGGDDDDAWGSFTSVNASDSSENPFGDDAFAPASSSTATKFHKSEPLTPLDWAEAFDREFDAQPTWTDAEEEDVPSIVVPEENDGDGNDSDAATPTSSWSFPGDEDDDQGEDLPPASASPKKKDSTTGGAGVSEVQAHIDALSIGSRDLRRPSLGEDDPRRQEEEEEASTASAAHPLGPGTAPGTAIVGGMVERTMEDGSVVRVPEDDVARGIDEAMERRVDEVDEPKEGGGELARRASREDAV